MKKYKVIYSKRVATQLMKEFELVNVKPSNHKQGFFVYVFEETPEFLKALNKITLTK